jgi:hydroxyethylthiazole kinase
MEDLAKSAAEALSSLRERRPLVQNITNYVSMDVAANLLLALGASPAMVHSSEEVEDFADISNALVVNIGTLSPAWVASMKLAAHRFKEAGKPWVLDPVGVGATAYRTTTAAALTRIGPTVIRGNASEIAALAGASAARVKGVDSTAASADALAPAKALAAASRAVVVVSGEVDYATDGHHVVSVRGGDALMPLVTALGCSLSASVAAFAAVAENPLRASVAALAVFAVAGRRAAAQAQGPATFRTAFIDAIHRLTPASLATEAEIALES